MRELRLFIALELNDALRLELKRLQRQLQDERALAKVRWVAPENIHLTLKFLGNVPESLVPALSKALARAAVTVRPFELTARGLGCFPNTRRPNNIWVGLEGAVDSATLLARRVESECAALGFAPDQRGFTLHLTLARIKREASPGERAAIGEGITGIPGITLGTIRANAVHLISSDLQPTGPIYSMLARVPLGED